MSLVTEESITNISSTYYWHITILELRSLYLTTDYNSVYITATVDEKCYFNK